MLPITATEASESSADTLRLARWADARSGALAPSRLDSEFASAAAERLTWAVTDAVLRTVLPLALDAVVMLGITRLRESPVASTASPPRP